MVEVLALGGMANISVDAFKQAFRNHPAGVAIITANTPEGPVGITASSVALVGTDPPALAFSVTQSGGSAGKILAADTFVVHLASAQNLDALKAFATSGAERFTESQGWSALETGEPHLPSARVALRCRAASVTPIGPSSLVLAEVLDIVEGTDGAALDYHDREFHVLEPARV